MTFLASVGIHQGRGESQQGLSPHPSAYVTIPRRCLRRDVDGPSAVSRGSGRRLEGESGWLEIQEARCDRCRRGAQQWSLCAATALRAQGVNADVRATGRGGKPKHRSGTKIAARGRRKAAWRSAKGLREPDGVPRKACRGLPGRLGPGPGLPMRRPRYPSHLRRGFCGADGACVKAREWGIGSRQ